MIVRTEGTTSFMIPCLATIVIMLHSALMMLVMLAIFTVFATVFPMLLAFVMIVLHPIHVELELEQVHFNFHARMSSWHRVGRCIWRSPVRHHVWRRIRMSSVGHHVRRRVWHSAIRHHVWG